MMKFGYGYTFSLKEYAILILFSALMLIMAKRSLSRFRMLLRLSPQAIKGLGSGFKEKIWMTIGLGSVFFSLYLLIAFLGGWFLNHDFKKSLFDFAYEHPLELAEMGLFAFICLSLFIYFVRLIIKYWYTTSRL